LPPGDWFVVPLPAGGFARGVVAFINPTMLVGYFFGPRMATIGPSDAPDESANAAILIARCVDASLRLGDWQEMGALDRWDPDEWPMPVFYSAPPRLGVAYEVEYDTVRLSKELRATPVPRTGAAGRPEDGLYGRGGVEVMLERLLPRPMPTS
jgi:hypothetical protein